MDPVDPDPQFHLLKASLLFRLNGLIGFLIFLLKYKKFLSLLENFCVYMSKLELGGV